MRRRYLGKRGVLERATGRAWQDVLREWDARDDLTYEQIADELTALVKEQRPDVRFTRFDVAKFIPQAREEVAA